MSFGTHLRDLVGEWTGTNRLWLTPDDPVRESDSTASVTLEAHGACAIIKVTWAEEGQPQEGVLVVRTQTEPGDVDVVWMDSWHMSDRFMLCRAENEDPDSLSVLGSYAAPPGPDWGWRIVLRAGGPDAFGILMTNITPQGQEVPAVEATYVRTEAARSGAAATFDVLYGQARSVIRPRDLSDSADAGGVGAAILSASGKVYTGVCIDTACSMGFCAEHAAAAAMVTAGESRVVRMLAVGWDGHIMPPCGRCREFISQLNDGNLDAEIMVAENVIVLLRDLLPYDWRRSADLES
jgi:cytidine deaminase